LTETISQFEQQGVTIKNAGILTSHPSSEEGRKERSETSSFLSNLNFLDTFVSEDGSIQNSQEENEDLILKALEEIQNTLGNMGWKGNENGDITKELTSNVYMHALMRSEGIFTLLSFLSSPSLNILHKSASCLLSTLNQSSSSADSAFEIKRKIQNLFTPVLPRLVNLIATHSKSETIFLRLAFQANKGCQQNKVALVRAGKVFPKLLELISIAPSQYSSECHPKKDAILLWMHSCQLLTTLCQYDDVTATASTAHDFAQELFRYDAVPILHKLLSIQIENTHEMEDTFSKLKCAIMSTQRVLAVNDEIVQALVAQGVLTTTCDALDQILLKEDSKDVNINIASAALGLIRNLCGNDDIKTNVCQKSLPSILSSLSLFSQSPKVHEHVLAILAAMSLRRISNANLLLQNNIIDSVLRSMQKYPDNEKIQRAGCLSIRNAIARQPESVKNGIKEDHSMLEHVLRNAGRFRGTVDEAYAALRDLGIRVEMIRYEEVEETDGNGVGKKNVVVKQRGVEMFGERKSNFRQTWEESEDIEERIDGLS